MSRLLVALSGGVDSAVAALLLKQQGHEVHGAYMRTWMNEEGGRLLGECPWEDDVANASAVAASLEIPFRVIDLIRDYRERIVEYLVEGYRLGITPNPDAMCNREMKFGIFLRQAIADGFDGVATGHYARRRDNADGTSDILEGLDLAKDQSYFLALLRQEQVRLATFPIGNLHKADVRALALKAGLPNAARKDSQGICFLGKVSINAFLALYIPDKPGPIINAHGSIVGQHRGLHRYTIGQRKGVDVPSNTDNEHYVVVAKDFETNTLRVAFERPGLPGLYTSEAVVDGLSWLNDPIPDECEMDVRVRYRDPTTRARFIPDNAGSARILFREIQRGLAPGQILALYNGPVLCGAGIFR